MYDIRDRVGIFCGCAGARLARQAGSVPTGCVSVAAFVEHHTDTARPQLERTVKAGYTRGGVGEVLLKLWFLSLLVTLLTGHLVFLWEANDRA